MTVEEMYRYLEELIKDGKGDYILTCDGGLNPVGGPGIIWENSKKIEVG